MHITAIPRFGGVAIMTSFAIIIIASILFQGASPNLSYPNNGLIFTLALAFPLSAISALDDIRSLSPSIRLALHFFLSSCFIAWLGTGAADALILQIGFDQSATLKMLILLALLVVIVWTTNLFNFMDGANGLAGLMGAIGFGTLAGVILLGNNDSFFMRICAGLSGACLGFLFFNFPKARVFMGDAGSITLGFLAATFGIYGWLNQYWPWWFAPLVFSPFIVDASVTLAKRIWKRERIWEGHRQHYYHRLILICDWSHTKTAIAYACLMMCVSTSGLFILWHTKQLPAEEKLYSGSLTMLFLWGWVVIYVLLLSFLEWRFSVEKRKTAITIRMFDQKNIQETK